MLARISVLLGYINPALGELWGIQLCIFMLVTVMTGLFLVGYLLQGTRVGFELWGAIRGIRALAVAHKTIEPDAIAAVLPRGPLTHLWEEYSDTLHRVRRQGDGALQPAEVRATVPAEMFFTRDALVDGRLFDDFTRHLPGVLTGLGIIGTFAGLLEGLSRFDATSSTTAVAGLKSLLDGVAHAFTTSAIAIACAMLVVFISKFALAIFYKQVETLNHLIDSSYATGAGEEYLSRLVHSTEMSDAHAANLKKELIEEFGRLLNTLSDRQMAANAENTQNLGRYMNEALKRSVAHMTRASAAEGAPPDQPPGVVRHTGGARDHAVGTQQQDATAVGFSQVAATLTELEVPVAHLLSSAVQLAAAVRQLQSELVRLNKD
jgi:hypothetical protein